MQWRHRRAAQRGRTHATASGYRQPLAGCRCAARYDGRRAGGGRAWGYTNRGSHGCAGTGADDPGAATAQPRADSAAEYSHTCAAVAEPLAGRVAGRVSFALSQPDHPGRNAFTGNDPTPRGLAHSGAYPSARSRWAGRHRADRGRSAAAAGPLGHVWA